MTQGEDLRLERNAGAERITQADEQGNQDQRHRQKPIDVPR